MEGSPLSPADTPEKISQALADLHGQLEEMQATGRMDGERPATLEIRRLLQSGKISVTGALRRMAQLRAGRQEDL